MALGNITCINDRTANLQFTRCIIIAWKEDNTIVKLF